MKMSLKDIFNGRELRHFLLTTRIHGARGILMTVGYRRKAVWTAVVLACLLVLVAQVSKHVRGFLSTPSSITVSPWTPERFPEMLYCPSAVFRNDYMKKHLYGKFKAFLGEIEKSMSDKMPAQNIPCLYLDSLSPAGQLMWNGRFTDFSQMSNRSEGDLYLRKELNDRLLLLKKMMEQIVNEHLTMTNSTFQQLMDDITLKPHEVIESAVIANNVPMLVSATHTTSGPCFLIQPPSGNGRAQLSYGSYTVVPKVKTSGEVCSWKVPFDYVVFGDAARALSPTGWKYLSLPAHYTFSLIPRIYKKLNTADSPCLDSITVTDQDICLYYGVQDEWCRKMVGCGKPTYDVVIDGKLYYKSKDITSVESLCSNLDFEGSCLKRFAVDTNTDDTVYAKCPMPCASTGYNFEVFVTPSTNLSAITVQYSDIHQGLSFVQEWSFTAGSLVGKIGGTLGLWCGITIVALLHAGFTLGSAMSGCCWNKK